LGAIGKELLDRRSYVLGLRQSELLEKLARYMQTQYAFPEPITIRLTHCSAPNAYWDEEYREVTLCFEFMTALLKIADQPQVTAAVERFRARQ
jgi:L-ribulose-5-phosphate 3-epimerase UlaE